MTDSPLQSVPWSLVAVGVATGLVGSIALPRLVSQLSGLFATALVGAVCSAVTVGVRSDWSHRGTVALAVFAEVLRSLAFFLLLVAFLGMTGVDAGRSGGFVVFSALFSGGAALVLGVVSLPVAAVVGGVTSVASDAL